MRRLYVPAFANTHCAVRLRFSETKQKHLQTRMFGHQKFYLYVATTYNNIKL